MCDCCITTYRVVSTVSTIRVQLSKISPSPRQVGRYVRFVGLWLFYVSACLQVPEIP